MIKISIRDSFADLPPSILKKRIKEIDQREKEREESDFQSRINFNTLDFLWSWLGPRIKGRFAKLSKNTHHGTEETLYCELVKERVLGRVMDIIYYEDDKEIVLSIHRNSGTDYTYTIEEQNLHNLSFTVNNKDELVINTKYK